MKYLVIEGSPDGQFNATNKAREDVEKILTSNGIKRLVIETKFGVQKNKLLKWKQFFIYRTNLSFWDKKLSELKKGDIVFIQYPIINTTANIEKVITKFKEKGIIFVAIIHDLDSLRFNENKKNTLRYKRVCKEDSLLLSLMNYVIAHNSSMKKELIKKGVDEKNIILLELFDYLIDEEICKYIDNKKNNKNNNEIIIAGNLSPFKSKYLSNLKKLNVRFNLYGVGFDESQANEIISYKGKFLPEELILHLEGNYGLIWDGDSVDTCNGAFGNYLRYNNPYKASLYLTSGIPIIVWSKSALSDFVIKNKVGIAIDSLNDLKEKLDSINDKEYDEMVKNALKISKKTRTGYYLNNSLKKIK